MWLWIRRLLFLVWAIIGIPIDGTAQGLPGGAISTAGADCSVATACVGFETAGVATFGLDLNVGTSITANFETSQNATSISTGTWRACSTTSVCAAATATADGSYYFSNPGFIWFRVRAGAISGAATVDPVRGFQMLGGGSGGGAGTSDTLEATQLLVLAAVDQLEGYLDTVETIFGTDAIFGTAGTPDADVLTIQGAPSMTPILATVTATNLDVQIGGSDVVAVSQSGTWDEIGINDSGNSITVDGTVTTTSDDQQAEDDNIAYSLTPPVMIALNYCDNATNWERCNNQDVVFGTTTYTEGTTTGPVIGGVRNDFPLTSLGNTDNEIVPMQFDALGLLYTRLYDPCSGVPKQFFPFSISTATTTEITPSLAGASAHWYICAVNIGTDAANDIALVDDNTDGCGSVTAGIAGGTTAASGWNFPAGGGLTLGNGTGTVMRTVTTNAVLCLVTSAATVANGTIVAVPAVP